MIDEVALALGNLPSTHVWYSRIGGTASLPGYIVRAANKLIRMVVGGNGHNADLFPELANSWTVGPTYPTTSGRENVIDKPSDCIVVQRITRSESSTLPTWATTQEKPLGDPIDAAKFGLIAKDATTAGYATIWARKGGTVLIWPTPTNTYTDYLRFYGLAREPVISDLSDSLRIDEHWHDLVVTLTCYLLAMRLGYKEDAANFLAMTEQELQQTGSTTAWQNDIGMIEIDGAPTCLSVYGEFD